MKSTVRGIARWMVRLIAVFLVLAALYVGVIVFPTPLFEHAARFGDYRVYSDEPIPAGFGSVIEQAARRLHAMEHEPRSPPPRIYLCESRKRYAFFAFLLRMNPESLAIGLSTANQMFVSMSRVREFEEQNGGLFRHTRFEGIPAEVIAHEVAHFRSVRALGYRADAAQPVWKREGWAEYQANVATIREDPNYDLGDRIDLLLDDRHWRSRHDAARNQWEWQLLVEFLGEVRGYRLADLIRNEVTRHSTREQMLRWYRER